MGILLNRRDLALCLLAVGAFRNYAWLAVPDDLRGMASKGLGSIATLVLLGIVLHAKPSKAVFYVVLWYAFMELQTVICSVWYLFEPWVVPVGQPICSAKVGFDLGAIGILAAACLLYLLAGTVNYRYRQSDRRPEK